MIASMRFGHGMGIFMLAAAVVQPQAVSSANRPAYGQAVPDDSLSRHLRELANNPRSVAALIGAGQSALDLGDGEAALGFFARAEELAPRDGRVKAGIGSALVMMEQAESALRFFGEARAFGVPEAEYAGDRGLAYDLTGNSRLAQKDYQVALRRRDDPEIRRRLALSLAISGDRDAALAAIDPLVRQQDRAAWRTRAFVLALSGDAAGAAKVVQAMMPGQAEALQPFLARLPSLSPADRALAVNFGHFPGNAQGTPLAANTVAPLPTPLDRGRPDPGQRSLGVSGTGGTPVTSTPQESRAAENRRETPLAAPARQDRPTPIASSPTAPLRAAEAFPLPSVAREPAPATSATSPPSQVLSDRPATLQGGSQVAALGPASPGSSIAPTAAGQTPPALVNAPPEPSALAQVIASPPTSGSTVAAAAPSFPSPQAVPSATISAEQGDADAGIARIAGFADVAALVAALPVNVPEAGREPAGPPGPAGPASSPAPDRPASAKRSTTNLTAAKTTESKTSGRGGESPTKGTEDPKVAPKMAAAKKAEAAKKAAAARKAEAARKEPSRIWVQVAHGPTVASLNLALNRIRRKGPELFANRSAWTTPLDRTNRLLIGPFRSNKEVAAFLAQLDKADITSFVWTSPAGQEISKLPGK